MALPESSSKDGQNGKSTATTTATNTSSVSATSTNTEQDDRDFDPSAEAMIDEIDDERTLEEEEALDNKSGPAVQEELDALKKESEMPLEELLAHYQRMRDNPGDESEEEEDEEEEDEEFDDDDAADEDDDDVGGTQGSRNGGAGPATQPRSPNDRPSRSPSADSTPPNPKGQSKNEDKSTEDSSKQDNHVVQSCSSSLLETSPHLKATSTSNTDERSLFGGSSSHTPSAENQVAPEQPIDSSGDMEKSSPSVVATLFERRQHTPMTNFVINDDEGDVFKTLLGYDLDDSDDMDEDYSYSEDDDDERDWRRVIHVGPDHQAEVPEGLHEYGDLPPYENEDKLVWRSNPNLTKDSLINYLKNASSISKRTDISISPASVPRISEDSLRLYRERIQAMTSNPVCQTTERSENITHYPPKSSSDVYMSQSRKRMKIDYELELENAKAIIPDERADQNQIGSDLKEDKSMSQDVRQDLSTAEYFQGEEQLLFLLLQCNFNSEEALRRRRLDPYKYYLHEPMSLWSQEECLGFEHGLRTYGKDFRSIRDNKVPTRTHSEVVSFYYLWKKSERHDVYTNQYKLDRKRSLSHPGTTDYMDKFIEDNESILNASSPSPPTPISIGVVSNSDPVVDNNSSIPLCNSSDIETPQIRYINLPQGSIIQKLHLQMHQSSRDEEGGKNNPVSIDSNSPL